MGLVEAQAPRRDTHVQFDEDQICAKEQLALSLPLAGPSKATSVGRQVVTLVAQSLETLPHAGTSDSIPREVERADPAKIAGIGSGADLQSILMTERHQNKPMDRLHCPLGSLREEAQKTTAIGLRIAMDNLRLRWSEPGQRAYEEAKKSANEALSAWNVHIRSCEICHDAKPGLMPPTMDSGFVTTPTVLLVDDNQAVLELLVGMLEPAYKIAATLCNGARVVDQAAALLPDLIILDISLGDISGFEVARRLKRAGSRAKIIFLSLHEDMDFVGAAFGLGASGFVFKSRLTTDLENAIAAVLSGGHFSSIR
jgi:CheY-like chemotaxis protein